MAAEPTERWSVDLSGPISYPLIADGRVYVTYAPNPGMAYGTRLLALDAATGAIAWGPVELAGTYFWSGLTYDAGRVFTVTYDGVMQAFDAASGALAWTKQLPGQYSFDSPPTAFGGHVYTGGAGSGGTLYLVRQSDGRVAWTASVANGNKSSPAVSGSSVFVSYACGQTYSFARVTGVLNWHRSTSCSGGGGKTPVLAHDKLYVRDFSFPAILDAANGAVLGSFAAGGPVPAVDATQRYVRSGSALTAVRLSDGTASWTFSGDGGLVSAPIVAGDTVIVGSSSGMVYGVSTATGAVTWSADAGAPIEGPDEQNVSQPLTGLASSGGLLVVPADGRLVADR